MQVILLLSLKDRPLASDHPGARVRRHLLEAPARRRRVPAHRLGPVLAGPTEVFFRIIWSKIVLHAIPPWQGLSHVLRWGERVVLLRLLRVILVVGRPALILIKLVSGPWPVWRR